MFLYDDITVGTIAYDVSPIEDRFINMIEVSLYVSLQKIYYEKF